MGLFGDRSGARVERPWRWWYDATVVLSALALLAESRVAPARGHLGWTLLVLWAPLCGYLVMTRRLSPPASVAAPSIAVVSSVVSLILFARPMFELRIASFAAGIVSVVMWTLIGLGVSRRGR